MQRGVVRQDLGGPACLTVQPLLSRVQVAFSLPAMPLREMLGAGVDSETDQDRGCEGQHGVSWVLVVSASPGCE